MLYFIVFCFLVFFLVLFLKLVSYFISELSILSREEASSYECGFEHHNLSRVPFSFRYFFLTLIFLLFDLEIVLMVFLGYYSFSNFFFFSYLVLFFFLFVLFLGLIYEWVDGSLDWMV